MTPVIPTDRTRPFIPYEIYPGHTPPRIPDERYAFYRSMTDEEMKHILGTRSRCPVVEEFPCLVAGIPSREYCFSRGSYVHRAFCNFSPYYANKIGMIIAPGADEAQDLCFVFFHDKATRDGAVQEMNGRIYCGNPLVVREAPQRDIIYFPLPCMDDWDYIERLLGPDWEEEEEEEESDVEAEESDVEADSGRKRIKLEGEGKDKPIDVNDHEEPGATDGVVTGLHPATGVDASATADVEVQEKIHVEVEPTGIPAAPRKPYHVLMGMGS